MKKLRMLLMGLSILVVFSQTGCVLFCSSVRHLEELEIGMSKTQVIQIMGKPALARGATKNKEDKVVEVWTYNLARPGCIRPGLYLVRFQDGKLSQWGQQNDWLRQPDSIQKNIYENETGKNKTGLY
jgi:hypothetical protein